MTRQITDVSITDQQGVRAAVLLLFTPARSDRDRRDGGLSRGRGMGMFLIFAPILYGAVGYVGSALFAAIYNVLAKRVGGVEFESVDQPSGGVGA